MKKVLYISYDGLTDPLGQSQVLPYLRKLSDLNFRFTVISFEKKNRFQKEGGIVRSIMEAANMKWVPMKFTSKPPILAKIYDRWKLRRIARKLYKQEKFDLVHCRSYVSAEVGMLLKRKCGAKFLFDMRGFWADEKVENGQWNQEKYLYRRIYKYYKEEEKQLLLEADGIVTLTKASRDYLHAQAGYEDLLIEVIPCCADLAHFDFHRVSMQEVGTLKASLGIPSAAKVIIYLGSVGGWYMTTEMFTFFRTLLGQDPNYMMLILTKEDATRVKEEAIAAGIAAEKIVVTYSQREQLPGFLALSHSSIFFIRSSFSKIASSPTKHAELMGMGVPVICNDIGDTGYIVESTKTGIIVKDFSQDTFRAVVLQMDALEKINKDHIRESAKQFFDLEIGVKKYSDEYNRIMG